MNKLRTIARFLGLPFLVVLALSPATAMAGWVLYDDFSSGAVDPARWQIKTTGGTISVVNGKAKLTLTNPGPRNAYMYFTDDVQSIKGVKLKVKIVKASGDLRARIGGYAAMTPQGHPVWQGIQLNPQISTISSGVSVDDVSDGSWLYDLFRTTFKNPAVLIGKWLTISSQYPNSNKYIFSATGQGTCTFVLSKGTLVDGSIMDLHIGLRSMDGTGTGIVYFDSVYVLK